jgi:hypothetical protein
MNARKVCVLEAKFFTKYISYICKCIVSSHDVQCFLKIKNLVVHKQTTDWTTEGSEFESRQVPEFSLHVGQTGSGAHTASCAMGTEDLFPGGKEARA